MRSHPTPEPPELGRTDGLAWARFLPKGTPRGAWLLLHGAASQKENSFDAARQARTAGYAALCFDMRGHGESDGALGPGALEDVATMRGLLPADVPLVLRGSSMGAGLAVLSAKRLGAAALVALCPAPPDLLRRLVSSDEELEFRLDRTGIMSLFDVVDYDAAIDALTIPSLFIHARGDERVPVELSEQAAERNELIRLVAPPGGHHRSIQHDAELLGMAVRFVERALRDENHSQ